MDLEKLDYYIRQFITDLYAKTSHMHQCNISTEFFIRNADKYCDTDTFKSVIDNYSLLIEYYRDKFCDCEEDKWNYGTMWYFYM